MCTQIFRVTILRVSCEFSTENVNVEPLQMQQIA